MNIPSAHPHYCLLFHSTPNNSFVPKSTAHRKVPLHTNAVHPHFGHIHRTIEGPVPSRAPNGLMSRVPQCQPHNRKIFTITTFATSSQGRKCLSTEMRTESYETDRGTHKIKDWSTERTHAWAARLERWDGDSNMLLLTRHWAQVCRI